MISDEERQLIIDVAVKYYIEGKIQSQIAKEVFQSRTNVSRLLKKARDLDIVDITINYQSEGILRLQGDIGRAFNGVKSIVVKTIEDDAENQKQVSKAAAKELGLILSDDTTMGISWGRHVRCMAKYLKQHSYKNFSVVELFGAVSYEFSETDMLSIALRVASKLEGTLYPLPVPIYIKDEAVMDTIVNTPGIRKSLSMIKECDFLVTGIGVVEGDYTHGAFSSYLHSNMRDEIIDNGAAGMIFAHYFNKKGEFLDISANKNIVGIKTETIMDKPVFAIASGIEKAGAIYAALKGGIVDTIVSDQDTLERVLKIYECRLNKITKI
jgi:deoxyribonucleoside regulator